MADPTPSPVPIPKGSLPSSLPPTAGASVAKTAAAGAAKTVASSAATVVAWKTAALATAAVLGLGGGGYYFNRDSKSRSLLTESEQKVASLEARLKDSDQVAESARTQLDQLKGELEKGKKTALDLEQAKAELAKLKDLSASEKKSFGTETGRPADSDGETQSHAFA